MSQEVLQLNLSYNHNKKSDTSAKLSKDVQKNICFVKYQFNYPEHTTFDFSYDYPNLKSFNTFNLKLSSTLTQYK